MNRIARHQRIRHSPQAMRSAVQPPRPAAPPASSDISPASVKLRQRPWTADMAQARIDADRVLASLDWSKRDFVINVPGTGDHQILDAMKPALYETWMRGEVSLVHMDYPTGVDFRRSVPQGLETLRLVLAGIAQRGRGKHRIYLFGQSQGAILMGEIMRDPIMRAGIERVAMWGHPFMAATHYHTPGADPKVWEFSNANDPITLTMQGNAYEWLDDLGEVMDGHLGSLPAMVGGLLRNLGPALAFAVWVGRGKVFPEGWMEDPHGYAKSYGQGLAFLKEGMALAPIDPVVAAANAARIVQQVAAGPHPWPVFKGQPASAGHGAHAGASSLARLSPAPVR